MPKPAVDRPTAPPVRAAAVLGMLSWLDQLLPVWSVLAKGRHGELGHGARHRRRLSLILMPTWGVGEPLMFTLAWWFPPDQAALRTGLILIGIAPRIAMLLLLLRATEKPSGQSAFSIAASH